MFENVCIRDGAVEFFEDPQSPAPQNSKLSSWISKNDSLLTLGYIGPEWSPTVKFEPVPMRSDNEIDLVLLDANSFTVNFAHFLLDNIYPQLQAIGMFKLQNANILLVNHNNCDDPRESWSNDTSMFDPTQTRHEHCIHLYQHFVPQLLGGTFNNAQDMIGTNCYKKLLAGQSSAFSLRSFDLSRNLVYQNIRETIKKRYSISGECKRKRIMVCTKKQGYDVTFWRSLCENVRSAKMKSKHQIVCSEDCMNPWKFRQNIKKVQKASIIVSEHGSLSHLSIYGPQGGVVLMVGHTEFKDGQYFLQLIDKYYFYIDRYQNDSLESYLRYAEDLTSG